MKRVSLGFLLLITAASTALPQGQIGFGNNLATLKAPIYGPELDWINHGGDYANAKTGNTATGLPPGTQIYNGSLAAMLPVSFWAAPGIVTNGKLLQQGNVTTLTGSGPLAGYFPPTSVSFANLPLTGVATVQVRVYDPFRILDFGGWDVNGAVAGTSALFTVDIGSIATGLRSFSIGFLDPSTFAPYQVPEPTTSGLLLAGSVVLVVWRWKKARSPGP